MLKFIVAIIVVVALGSVLLVGMQTDISGQVVSPGTPEQGDVRNFQENLVSGVKVCSYEKLADGTWEKVVEPCL